jgi:hypothetical protein
MADTIKMNMATATADEILKHLNYSYSTNNDDDESSLSFTSKQSQVYACLSDDASSNRGGDTSSVHRKPVAVTIDAARQILSNKLHTYHEDSSNAVLRVILHDDLVLQALRICETLDNKLATAVTGHAHSLTIGQNGQGITVSLSSIAYHICYCMVRHGQESSIVCSLLGGKHLYFITTANYAHT